MATNSLWARRTAAGWQVGWPTWRETSMRGASKVSARRAALLSGAATRHAWQPSASRGSPPRVLGRAASFSRGTGCARPARWRWRWPIGQAAELTRTRDVLDLAIVAAASGLKYERRSPSGVGMMSSGVSKGASGSLFHTQPRYCLSFKDQGVQSLCDFRDKSLSRNGPGMRCWGVDGRGGL